MTWSSKKQSTIALLSTEAEYRGDVVVACGPLQATLSWRMPLQRSRYLHQEFGGARKLHQICIMLGVCKMQSLRWSVELSSSP